MTISDQIKVLCVRSNISMAELARRLGKSPQAFNAKLKRKSFTIEELEIIADAVDAKFLRSFELSTGDKI
ncbi:helix-turn-helix domain-containing protein [Holdemania massiliensis]|uniref:Winged helix-turn-helix transcriptional regulator n=1 Tax=Holdemania massiliensis TaxID=1468449 RepID=A0A6N7S2D8_9FIRM|nr:helix-turn-helix domain-containing protein [Holdemania massiliensis]MSA69817.1 winged helix-turn-helix transcriptional regulator [Holdemania massiliensis]MSA88027.1 winged helix-turn-helix transcriptional regulator [Holdemania massiliensis]MSB76897.1 winged helix-turn-helix transcriptional regulator [Holdemania massiliensis]MSC31823.1 winged helix-turn-helix transcriptional regulator [Holdemania massiliensis]MSC38143.1 winged helix-turn-helix transcriptional regulator [Holdemania massiliens